MTGISVEDRGALVARLEGEIDLDHAAEVRKVLLDCVARNRLVLVELAAVSYIDSSGIAALIEALQSARGRGGDLALVGVSTQAARVLALARLDKVFTIHPDLDSALASGG